MEIDEKDVGCGGVDINEDAVVMRHGSTVIEGDDADVDLEDVDVTVEGRGLAAVDVEDVGRGGVENDEAREECALVFLDLRILSSTIALALIRKRLITIRDAASFRKLTLCLIALYDRFASN